MIIVGERINTSRKLTNECVANRDAAYIQADVRSQINFGADLIDVNAGSRRDSEVNDLLWPLPVVQSVLRILEWLRPESNNRVVCPWSKTG
jgi:cobalamin-dependent methionine synthase I